MDCSVLPDVFLQFIRPFPAGILSSLSPLLQSLGCLIRIIEALISMGNDLLLAAAVVYDGQASLSQSLYCGDAKGLVPEVVDEKSPQSAGPCRAAPLDALLRSCTFFTPSKRMRSLH